MPQSYSVPPAAGEHAEFYAKYVALVPPGDILATLDRQRDKMLTMLGPIHESRAGFRYAEGKWSIREVVGHIADAERVFAYRMLRIGRGDQTPLAAFDENLYMPPSGYDSRHLREITAELAAVRDGTVALLRGLPTEAMERTGTASGHTVSVRALAWISAGHELHHQKLLRERYLA
jgi:uncharacterized damage-inducible protein DinB